MGIRFVSNVSRPFGPPSRTGNTRPGKGLLDWDAPGLQPLFETEVQGTEPVTPNECHTGGQMFVT